MALVVCSAGLASLPFPLLSRSNVSAAELVRTPNQRTATLTAWPGEMNIDAAAETITANELKQYVSALADDTFEGRATGSRGGRAAAGYLQGKLKAFGLAPAGERGTYFQTFDSNSRNILAKVAGSDPALAKEVVLVSAHYDHVGYGNARNSYGPTGYIHNGADDNASGSATLLEVAEACAKLDPKPKRTIVFALWDAEETGLNGSKFWLSRPTVPLADVKLMINMDMVGRLRSNNLTVYGTRTARGLRKLTSMPNRDETLAIDFSWEIKNDSDHHPFYMRGIPILMLHTGLHGDYHRPSDDVEKLNIDGMHRIARLLYGIVTSAADQAQLPSFRQAVRSESSYGKSSSERIEPPPPGRLGLQWDRHDASAPGLKVVGVTPGAPAAQAGLKVGDRLLAFNGVELAPGTDLAGLVVAAQNPVKIAATRAGAEQPLELTVQLRGNPSKLGIQWREDDAEAGSVKVVAVVPSSPAAKAGIRPLDRIYAVNDQEFASGSAMRQLLDGVTAPYQLLVERGGRVHQATIEPVQPVVAR
ncbi:MAG TPA: M20/M25/M40 family metallo-hydrolase [Pirellulales bacterium]|nr:M20/M25/M40 family metallo-hydrolase [Pirellulales bacterium]